MPMLVAVICNGGLRGSESAAKGVHTQQHLCRLSAISVGKSWFSDTKDSGNFVLKRTEEH